MDQNETKPKRRPAKNKTAASNSSITDIPHEDVPVTEKQTNTSAGTDVIIAEEVTVEVQIKREVAKFNVADDSIAKLKQAYAPLKIEGPEDKDGYAAVKEAWNVVRSYRTGVEKKKTQIKADYLTISRAIDKEEARLVGLLKPLEDDLYKKWKDIDEAKEAEKQRKQREEEQRAMARVEELMNNGMVLKDGFYQLGDTISMDVATLRSLPDDQYQKLLGVVKARKAELDELARLKDQEEERKRQEQQKAEEELRKQQEQLRREQELLKQQQEELLNARREIRGHKLQAIGFIPTQSGGYRFVTPIMTTPLEVPKEIIEVPDNQFNHDLAIWTDVLNGETQKYNDHLKAEQEKKERQDREEAERKQAKEKRRAEIAKMMEAAGFTYDYGQKQFWFKNDHYNQQVIWEELETIQDDILESKIKQLADHVGKAKLEQGKTDKAKAEEEQQLKEQAMSDKELFDAGIIQLEVELQKFGKLRFKTKKFIDKSGRLFDTITGEINHAKKQ